MPRQPIPPTLRAWAMLWVALCWGLAAWHVQQRWPATTLPEGAATAPSDMAPAQSWIQVDSGDLPQPATAPSAHASQLLTLPNHSKYGLAAFWFAGERESAPDVRIAMSLWDKQRKVWTRAQWVVDRHLMGQQLGHGLRRLGNPVAWLDANERLHLFVVATGLGGWAASRVLHLQQADHTPDLSALKMTVVRVLPLSWLWNTSHLVRNPPLPLADGGMVLPLHFELGIKYPVLAWFGPHGEFRGLRRHTARTDVLQPSLIALSSQHWLALMRTQAEQRQVTAMETNDSGNTWHTLKDLDLPNPDAAVAAFQIAPQVFALIHHPSQEGRKQLVWHSSTDGTHWSAPMGIAAGGEGSEFSYPAMAWSADSLWMSYTNHRTHISWQRWQPVKAKP